MFSPDLILFFEIVPEGPSQFPVSRSSEGPEADRFRITAGLFPLFTTAWKISFLILFS